MYGILFLHLSSMVVHVLVEQLAYNFSIVERNVLLIFRVFMNYRSLPIIFVSKYSNTKCIVLSYATDVVFLTTNSITFSVIQNDKATLISIEVNNFLRKYSFFLQTLQKELPVPLYVPTV